MRILKIVLTIVSVVVCLMGLLWMGQGSGLFPYPAGNFMIDQTPWVLRGALLFLAGLIVLWIARRRL